MSRWTAPSDLDYHDEPWNRPEPCATRGCAGTCDLPATSAFCYECRCEQLRQHAIANEQHQQEVRGARPTRTGAAS